MEQTSITIHAPHAHGVVLEHSVEDRMLAHGLAKMKTHKTQMVHV
jgi:hypothetical protein